MAVDFLERYRIVRFENGPAMCGGLLPVLGERYSRFAQGLSRDAYDDDGCRDHDEEG
jgi:hypothetical protein